MKKLLTALSIIISINLFSQTPKNIQVRVIEVISIKGNKADLKCVSMDKKDTIYLKYGRKGMGRNVVRKNDWLTIDGYVEDKKGSWYWGRIKINH